MNGNATTKTLAVSLDTLCVITGIVLCVLQGVGTINIGWFWATFPFWAWLALEIAVIVILILIALMMAVFVKKDRWEGH